MPIRLTSHLSLLYISCLLNSALCASDFSSSQQAILWQSTLKDFSQDTYRRSLETLWQSWSQDPQFPLQPNSEKTSELTIGIKVYTYSGLGLATPHALTQALIAQLQQLGIPKQNIFLIDQSAKNLRQAGYLPPLSQPQQHYQGIAVYALDSLQHYDSRWYYDSALPSPHLYSQYDTSKRDLAEGDTQRHSLLPIPLLFQADYWINLPVLVEQKHLGLLGSLSNGTLHAISNYDRFLLSPQNGAAAATEIAAIPELRQTWLLNLLSLEKYQFIGGPRFNAYYTRSQPLLWASTNPLLTDYLGWITLNQARKQAEFPPIEPQPLIFRFGQQLQLGPTRPQNIVEVNSQ